MTVQVRIRREDTHDKDVGIYLVDGNNKKRTLVTKLSKQGEEYVGVVYDRQDIVIQEMKSK